MCEEDIEAVKEWFASDNRPFCYIHTAESEEDDVMFVSAEYFKEFADFIGEIAPYLICIFGKISGDGIWFSTADLRRASIY